ncbi:MAG TPA: hypothetical protein VF137_12500 [Candidatus Dormibacteraeota bacterium]
MADFGLFVGWGNTVRGREMKSLGVFTEALQWWGAKQQSGEIESVTVCFLTPHGGDLAGFLLIRGEQEKLMQITASDEYQTLNTKANLVVEHFGALPCILDSEVQRVAGQFGQLVSEVT